MDIKQQTKVTEQNLNSFFQKLYHHQTNNKKQLVDLDVLNEPTAIVVDCCGWHYKKLFPNKSVVAVETIKTVKQFNLDKTYFDRLIDNQSDDRLGWPSIPPGNCAVIFDRSPLLKYQTLAQISNMLAKAADKYVPDTVILEQSLTFIDDVRSIDRFYDIAKIEIAGYVVTKFMYDTDGIHLSIRFKKKSKAS
jgi:hypothetical protein